MDERSRVAEPTPSTIGRYKVQASIGAGAMGAVYKAFDPLIKRTLAIKTIRLDIPRDSAEYQAFIERFYHEARILGTLSHPNIVTLFDIGEEGGVPYLAMEFVEGETVESLLRRGSRFGAEKVVALIGQVASAIDYAHGRGVIHRDIKPSNLILSNADRIKVTDFGIAKMVDSGTHHMGTPSYMSPEQAMREKLDGRTDIFSLGVCAFVMLSGEQPFPGSDADAVLDNVVNSDPIEPAHLEANGLVPQKWREVFHRVLAKSPDDRYQTAAEFVQELEYCLGAWFGAAMGDQTWFGATIDEGGKQEAPPAGSVAKIAPAVAPTADAPPAPAEEEIPETLDIKAGSPASQAGVARAVPAATPPAGPQEQGPETVDLKTGEPLAPRRGRVPKAVEADLSHQETVVGAVPSRTRASAAPAAVPEAEQATVLMSTPKPAQRPAMPPTPPKETAPPPEPPPPVPEPPPARRRTTTPAAARTMVPSRPAPPAPPVAAPRRGGLSTGLILGGAGLALVLAGVIAVVVLRRPSATSASPPAEPTPAPAGVVEGEGPGSLSIETQPKNAAVTINGQPRGATPVQLGGLPLASYAVKLELKGYESQTQVVLLTSDAPRAEVKLPLLAASPEASGMGTADVLSAPAGALIKVDGAGVGVTPLADFRIAAGSHRLEVVKEGYETWSGKLEVEAARRVKVDAPLKAVARPTPTPEPQAVVAEEKIYLENEVDTPPEKLSGAGVPAERVKLKPGEVISITASFVITETGKVADIAIVESGGSKGLDAALKAALRGWKYSPAVKQGEKVQVRIFRKFTFKTGS